VLELVVVEDLAEAGLEAAGGEEIVDWGPLDVVVLAVLACVGVGVWERWKECMVR
jgi:uncharacterized OsmC-like protein